MNRVVHSITLDLLKGGNQTSISVKRGEVGARRLGINLVCGTLPYVPDPLTETDAGDTISLMARKPDNTELFNATTFEGSTVFVDLTSQTVAVAGVVKCELRIAKGSNTLYSPQFEIIVEDYLIGDDDIPQSEDESTELSRTIANIPYTFIKYSDAEPAADTDMKDTPSEYIGVYVGTSHTAPTAYTSYTWYKYKGDKGEKGDKGDQGNTGAPGVSVTVGTTTTGEPGTDASVSNSGTVSNPVLNFVVPQGEKGDAGEKGDPGPQGAPGEQGPKGDPGDGVPTNGGSTGDVLTKTATGTEWSAPSGGDVQSVDGVEPHAQGNVPLSAVRYAAQTLTDAQQERARANIDAQAALALPLTLVNGGTQASTADLGCDNLGAVSWHHLQTGLSDTHKAAARQNIGLVNNESTLSSSTASISETTSTAARYGNVVCITIRIYTNAAIAANTTLFVLPTGFRPPVVSIGRIAGVGDVQVDSGGNVVTLSPIPSAVWSLGSITYAI